MDGLEGNKTALIRYFLVLCTECVKVHLRCYVFDRVILIQGDGLEGEIKLH